jgi:hypothetical protein
VDVAAMTEVCRGRAGSPAPATRTAQA